MQNYLFLHRLVLSEFYSVNGDSMFLSGALGLVFWIWSKRWFKGYKYRNRLLIRILTQLCIVGLISILSTTIVSPPRSYGDVSIFMPLSYPLTMHWGISGFLVWPPHHYYTISVFGEDFTGGGFEFGVGPSIAFQVEIFLNSISLFFLMNVVFTGVLLVLSETLDLGKIRLKNW